MKYQDILTGRVYYINQKQFIEAFRYLYGGTVATAKGIYNRAKSVNNYEYIFEIINSYHKELLTDIFLN